MSRYLDTPIVTHADGNQYFAVDPFPGAPVQEVGSLRAVTPERIDLIAHDTSGDRFRWDEVMALNPEYLSPDDIPVGTRIRVPRP